MIKTAVCYGKGWDKAKIAVYHGKIIDKIKRNMRKSRSPLHSSRQGIGG